MNIQNLIANNLTAITDLAYYTRVTIVGNTIEYTVQPDYGMPQTVSIEANGNDTIAVTTMAEDMDTLVETMPASALATILSDDYDAASAAHTRAFPHA